LSTKERGKKKGGKMRIHFLPQKNKKTPLDRMKEKKGSGGKRRKRNPPIIYDVQFFLGV